MLRINAIPNNGAAKAYYSAGDYYIDGHEAAAQWHGNGAELLGLSGAIERQDFERLCDNLHPATGNQLTAKHLDNRRVGYDLTFSVPKSLSLAYSLGGDERIATEFRAAVADTMAELEREMATRVRKKGADFDRTTGNMIWADFLHHTSRPIGGYPDPQLHVHAVVFNATFDREEGQWKAGQFGRLKADGPYFQAVFRARLAERVQAIGYDIRRTKDDFEIAGVPERTLKEFSRRAALIDKMADQLGVKRPETKAKLGATTREAKAEGQTWPMLLRAWERRLKPGELQAVNAAVADSINLPMAPLFDNAAALDWAVRHEFERSSVVPQRKLVTTALKHGVGSVTLDGLYEELGQRKDLIRRTVNGVAYVSTHGIRKEEEAILKFAVQGRGRYAPLGVKGAVVPDTLVPGENKSPSVSQAAAIRHLWASPDRVIVWGGKAGVGKTDALKAALASVNVRWRPFATQSSASRGVLRESGFHNADTLASLFNSREMQESVRGGLIVVDEAGQTGSAEFRKLTDLAEGLGARILVVGDHRQHKSVARGDVLKLLVERANLPVAEVSEIKRQSGEYRQVAEMLSKGQVGPAFTKLDGMGWVKETGVEADYLAALKAGKTALIVAPTHAEGDRLTDGIRERLKAEGKVKEEKVIRRLRPLNMTKAEVQEAKKHPEPGMVFVRDAAYREETQAIGVGDILRTTAPIKD